MGELSVPPPVVGEVMTQEAGFTPALAGSKLIVAVMADVPCAWSEELLAESETSIAAKVNVRLPVFVESLAAAAVIVMGTSLGGGVAGAVYVTEVAVGLLSVPAPVAGEIVQELGSTPLLAASLVTIAEI